MTVTSAPIAERLAVELSLPDFTTYVCRGWDSNTQPSACEANALNHLRHRRGVLSLKREDCFQRLANHACTFSFYGKHGCITYQLASGSLLNGVSFYVIHNCFISYR